MGVQINAANLREKLFFVIASEAKQSTVYNVLWIASGFAFAMTNRYFTLKLTALGFR
jgi:hypothetical protein